MIGDSNGMNLNGDVVYDPIEQDIVRTAAAGFGETARLYQVEEFAKGDLSNLLGSVLSSLSSGVIGGIVTVAGVGTVGGIMRIMPGFSEDRGDASHANNDGGVSNVGPRRDLARQFRDMNAFEFNVGCHFAEFLV